MCGGEGHTEIAHCPKKLITTEIAELAMDVDDVERGLPPRAGGKLDQTPSFLQGMTVLRVWESRLREDMRKKTQP